MHPALPLLILLPGWCLIGNHTPPRRRLPAILAGSVAVSSLVAMVLLAGGVFDPWLVVAAELPLLLLPLRRRHLPTVPLRPHVAALVVAAAVIAFAAATAGEPFDGDGDAGVYTVTAAHIAASGHWSWPVDEVIPSGMPLSLATRIAPYAVRWKEFSPGFLVRDDRVVPQFLPGYPLWGAMAATGDRLGGCLTANLIGVLLLMVSIGELAHRLVPRRVAWAVPVAIGSSAALLVFTKNPSAEVFLAGLLAAWLLMSDIALRRCDRAMALLAGATLAVAVATKFFAWAVVGVAVIHVLFLRPRRLRLAPLLLGPAMVTAGLCAVLAAPHLENHLRQLFALKSFAAAVAAGAVVLGLRLVVVRVSRHLAVASAIIGLAAFAWLALRGATASGWVDNDLLEMGRLLGRTLLIGAALGWACWIVRRRRPWHILPAAVFIALTLFIATGSGDTPFYPFAARRTVPVTLPLAVLMLAFLVSRLPRPRSAIAGLLVILPVVPSLWVQRSAVAVPNGAGFRATLEDLRAALPAGVPVVATGQARRYVAVLALLDGLPVVSVDLGNSFQLRPMFGFFRHHPDALLLTDEWRATEVLTEIPEIRDTIAMSRTPPLEEAGPRRLLLRLVRPGPRESRLTSRIDIGRDDQLRVAGFYAPENSKGHAIRWSSEKAWVLIPDGAAVRFRWAPGDRPEPAPVTVMADGVPLGQGTPAPGGSTSQWFDLPPGQWLRLVELRCPPFVPANLRPGSSDFRRLGVRLDTVEVRPRPPGPGDPP